VTSTSTRAPRLSDRLQAAATGRPLVLLMAGIVLYSIGPVLVQASDVSGVVFGF
jgi:hypothetical protein